MKEEKKREKVEILTRVATRSRSSSTTTGTTQPTRVVYTMLERAAKIREAEAKSTATLSGSLKRKKWPLLHQPEKEKLPSQKEEASSSILHQPKKKLLWQKKEVPPPILRQPEGKREEVYLRILPKTHR